MNDFIGYRGFNINHENKLRSLTYHYVWESKTVVTECFKTPFFNPLLEKVNSMVKQETSREHLAKDVCSCGLYSVKSIKDFLKAGHACHIIGKVVSSGIIVEGEKGFRAEKMTILELYENSFNSFYRPELTKQNLLALCDYYQIPLVSYSKEEWDKFLPETWEEDFIFPRWRLLLAQRKVLYGGGHRNEYWKDSKNPYKHS